MLILNAYFIYNYKLLHVYFTFAPMRSSISSKNIRLIAWPIIAGSFATNILNITDTAFVGRLGTDQLAATALATTFYLILMLVCFGLAIGAQIIIARRAGENNPTAAGKTFTQSLMMLIALATVLLSLCYPLYNVLFNAIVQNPSVKQLSTDYLAYRLIGIVFVAINCSFNSLFTGIARTRNITVGAILMATLNVLLDYLLIFGVAGFPKMGIKGAAIASVIAEGTVSVLYFSMTLRLKSFKPLKLFHDFRPDIVIMRNIIRLASPTMLQHLISFTCWFLFFIIIEKSGPKNLAASNILRSLLLLFMMPIWGFSSAANSLTGNLMGQRKPSLVGLLIKRVIFQAWIVGFAIAPIVFIFPNMLIGFFTNDISVIALCYPSIYVVYIAVLVFIPGIIMLMSLSGAGDTRATLLIELAAIIFYLAFAWGAGLIVHAKLEWIWTSEILYWIIIVSLAYIRLRKGKWKSIIV